MGKSPSIENFLELSSRSGRFESQGVFTLSPEKALEKLAAYQLSRPQDWVLKVLQAAVAGGASSVDIRQGKKVTFFTFSPHELFDVSRLRKVILTQEHAQGAAVRSLTDGLRAVGFGSRRPFTLALEEGRDCFLLGWDGRQLAEGCNKVANPETGPLVRLGVCHPSWAVGPKDRSEAAHRAELETERKTVISHGEAFPIPLTVNGRRVDTLSAPLVDPGHGLGRRGVLSTGWCPPKKDLNFPPLGLPQGIPRERQTVRFTDRFTDNRVFQLVGETGLREVSCMVKLSYGFHIDSHRSSLGKFRFHNKPRHSYVHWVMDGIVIDRHRWSSDPAAVSFDLYLSAAGLPTDASGLKVVRRPDVAHRILRALPWVAEQALTTSETIARRVPRPFGYHTTVAGVFGLLAVSNPAFLFQILAGGVAAAHLALSVYDKRQLMQDAVRNLKKLAQDLERR